MEAEEAAGLSIIFPEEGALLGKNMLGATVKKKFYLLDTCYNGNEDFIENDCNYNRSKLYCSRREGLSSTRNTTRTAEIGSQGGE